MDILRACIGMLIVLFLGIVLGISEHFKHPVTKFYTWVAAIAVLILVRFWL